MLALAKRLLGALAIVDVVQQYAPPVNGAGGIAKRAAPALKPTIDTVRSLEALLRLEGVAGGERSRGDSDVIRQILGMNRVDRLPLLEVLQRPAEVIQQLAIHDFDLTGPTQQTVETRDVVDDQARILLALLQLLIGHLELTGSLCDALVELARDSPLFAHEACLLQPEACLVGSGLQQQLLRVVREHEPLRADDDDAKVTVDAQLDGRDAQIG